MKIETIKAKLMVLTMTLAIAGMTQVQGQVVGELAPDFDVGLLEGGTYKLSEQKGKVVFVFLFGHTCPYCVAIAPSIEANIYQAYKNDSAFSAIGVDTWPGSNVSNVSGFKGQTGVTFPLAIMAGSVATLYNTTYDRMMVIDHNGILVHKGGTQAKNDLDNVIAALNQSLIATGLEAAEQDFSSVKVYPVPARDVVFFEAKEPIIEIRMFDVTGKLALKEAYGLGNGNNNRSVALEAFEKGIYFYTIQTEKSTQSGKLLIQR